MSFVRKIAVSASKHMPEILMAAGAGTFAASLVMAAKAAPIVEAHKDQSDILNDEAASKREKIVELAKVSVPYIPTVLMASASLTCFIGAHCINTKRRVALATAYSLLSQTANRYQDQVIDKFGEEVHNRIFSESVEEDGTIPNTEIDEYGSDTMLVYDRVTGRYFRSSPAKIREAESKINKYLIDEIRVPLNTFYEELDIEDMSIVGEMMGWDVETCKLDVIFKSKLTEDNQPCLVLVYRTVVINRRALD